MYTIPWIGHSHVREITALPEVFATAIASARNSSSTVGRWAVFDEDMSVGICKRCEVGVWTLDLGGKWLVVVNNQVFPRHFESGNQMTSVTPSLNVSKILLSLSAYFLFLK